MLDPRTLMTIRDKAGAHPWDDQAQREFESAIEVLLKAQRNQCAAAVIEKYDMADMPERVLNVIVNARL